MIQNDVIGGCARFVKLCFYRSVNRLLCSICGWDGWTCDIIIFAVAVVNELWIVCHEIFFLLLFIQFKFCFNSVVPVSTMCEPDISIHVVFVIFFQERESPVQIAGLPRQTRQLVERQV